MSTTPFRNRRLVMVGVSVALGGGTILASTVARSSQLLKSRRGEDRVKRPCHTAVWSS